MIKIQKENALPVYIAIVDYVSDRIKQGELKPGDRLISERELCEQFGVSRTSVRKALAILSGMGLVQITPRNGAFIAQANSQPAIDSLSQMVARNRYQAANLYEVRRLIEVQAARLAAMRRGDGDVVRLWELYNATAENVNAQSYLHQADMDLHIGIAESTKNPFFAEFMRVLISAYMEIFDVIWAKKLDNAEEDELFKHFINQHRMIVQAIADRDADAAVYYMTQHIDDSRKRYERVLNVNLPK